jgi:hypothetical protein
VVVLQVATLPGAEIPERFSGELLRSLASFTDKRNCLSFASPDSETVNLRASPWDLQGSPCRGFAAVHREQKLSATLLLHLS